ncbi:transposase [Paraburkholderia bannensis]|uniref:Transposase n=1 Tax=Paraburkholderia bannensis TaxID=765414 RepID=A0A7W9TW49_9BURK|nr:MULTISPECIES: transposase [Paraburkholderia]MBB3257498.1 transposase [Paraburkholderia sp. WP4_3_2]MBB6102511.1 transposase [Paraburkholderia bannensis]
MNFVELSDDEWALVSSLVSDEPPIRLNRRGRPRAEPRVVANAVLWILTTGESWSRLPARYPSGPTCRRRFEEWHVSGTLLELVQLLTQRGRRFVYVPEPAQAQAMSSPQATPAVAVVAEEAIEDDGLPAVYWKSPEAWQAPALPADAAPLAANAAANPIESMTRQLARLDEALLQAQHRTPAARAGAGQVSPRVPPQADSTAHAARVKPHAAAAVRTIVPEDNFEVPGATPLVEQIAEWRGYVVHLSVEAARSRTHRGMYRAAAEILKDGKRVERSGLVGPAFDDADAARHYAFDWARQWIDREGPHRSRDGVGGADVDPEDQDPGVSLARAYAQTGAEDGGVVTRAMPMATSALATAGSHVVTSGMRHAPLQRYTSSALLASGESHEASTATGADRHPHASRYRTHLS